MLRSQFPLQLAKSGSFCPIEVQIFSRSRRHLYDKRPGLIERQRKAADFVRHAHGEGPVGLGSSRQRCVVRDEVSAAEDEQRTLLWLHPFKIRSEERRVGEE